MHTVSRTSIPSGVYGVALKPCFRRSRPVLVVSSGLGMKDVATSEAVNAAGASPTISDNVRRQLETEARCGLRPYCARLDFDS